LWDSSWPPHAFMPHPLLLPKEKLEQELKVRTAEARAWAL
jgi:hypothetical protein